MAYPSIISVLPTPQPTDRLNSPSHSGLHQSENTAITEIETFVGTISSAQGTLVYDIRSPNSNGGGHIQTANKGGTGQTAYNKGDVLVAQSSSVLTKLSVGADNQALIADSAQPIGVKWATPAGANVQSFIATGTWNKPSTLGLLSPVFVEIWGGGGAGGAVIGSGAAGGGGGGFYTSGWFIASMLGTSELIIVGLGGASVIGNSTGNAGGMTIFGTSSLLTAFGGGGGEGATATGAGGGGGGLFTVGGNGVNTVGGVAGNSGPIGSVFSSGGGSSSGNAQNAMSSTGGGGAGGNGGNTLYGGAGGAGINLPTLGIPGSSKLGGSGGIAAASTVGGIGSIRGGGGGAAAGSATVRSGQGGGGFALVTSFP